MGVRSRTYIASRDTLSMAASPRCLPDVVSYCCRPCSLADSSPRRDCVFQVEVAISDFVQTPSVSATTASANQTGKSGRVQALNGIRTKADKGSPRLAVPDCHTQRRIHPYLINQSIAALNKESYSHLHPCK